MWEDPALRRESSQSAAALLTDDAVMATPELEAVVAESVRQLLHSLARFPQQLNLGEAVVKVSVDLNKLQSLPVLDPASLSSMLQQHVLDLQRISDKLDLLVGNGPSGHHEAMLPAKSTGDPKKVAEGCKPNSNEAISLETKVRNDIENKPEGPESAINSTEFELVQIKASRDEIERRISAFIERKQAENNENNIREFCNVIHCNLENSCARTDAVFTPHPGFKSHVKVSRVVNTYGPQTRPENAGEFQQKSDNVNQDCGNPAVEERLQNMEAHLKLQTGGPVPIDIYRRIKRLEDRILHLEGLSPEYFHHVNFSAKRRKVQAAQSYSLTELDEKIHVLKAVLLQKANDQAHAMESEKISF
uniref:MAP3K12 binding inhibitory protein 1 n=2 Tax=Callorhinchus milii TaxID=7868 RepID=A0A4W3GJQ8_CALMI